METQSPPKPITDAQTRFMRRLAHEVTGNGDGYIAAINAKYARGLTASEASAEINHLKSLQGGARPMVQPKKKSLSTTSAPVGRYSVDLPGGKGPTLVEITKPTSGPWSGYTFVKTVPFFLGGEAEPIRGAAAIQVLNAVESDPRGCSAAYGQVTGRCGLCNRRLTDPSSVQLGIGPECVGRF